MSRRKFSGICFSILVFLALWFYRTPLLTSLHWFNDLDAVTATIEGYGLWGPAILCILFILQTFLALIPGQALMVASGYIYGFSSGIMIT
ncbi:MAG TPA: hypothetical protein VFR47_32625 [Anaerolineales bacterium]|nr:hypothetical protein [Anaerolineales bacterium]